VRGLFIDVAQPSAGELMSTIAESLASLGMSNYAERSADDNIDFDVLGELRDQDFDRLGGSFWNRRRMLRAMRDIKTGSAR
jgi:SAM domain (Sterile alpha motif)